MSKLGISYNLFDAEEHLEPSIKCIRDHVDYINVIYQTISNFGNKAKIDLKEFLIDLKSRNIIDDFIEFKSNATYTPQAELDKRQYGFNLAIKNNCTHFMSMDTDEYYIPNKFKEAKDFVIDFGITSSYCQMISYYKSSEYILDPPEDYYVPFIHGIHNTSIYKLLGDTPVLTDPTRRHLPIGNCIKIFNREELEMHHMSYVRRDIRQKLTNSTASLNFKDQIDEMVKHYENWEYPNPVLWGGLPPRLLTVKKIKPYF